MREANEAYQRLMDARRPVSDAERREDERETQRHRLAAKIKRKLPKVV